MSSGKRNRAAAGAVLVKSPPVVLPPTPALGIWQSALIVLRHALPNVFFVALEHAASHFLLLTVFNLALTFLTLAVVRTAISMRGQYVTVAALAGVLATAIVNGYRMTILAVGMFGWVIAMLVENSAKHLFSPEMIGSAVIMIAATFFQGMRQIQNDLKDPIDEAAAKRRHRPFLFVNLFCAGLLVLWTPYAFELGRIGLCILASVLTGLFMVRDLRPDMVRRYAPGQASDLG